MKLVCIVAILAASASAALADFQIIDIDSHRNGGRDNTLLANGGNLPIGNQTFAGVPFDMGGGPSLSDPWAYYAHVDAGGNVGAVSETFDINVFGVTDVYTLMSTFWGAAGPNSFVSVTFNGSDGAVATFNLVGNVDLRDYNFNPTYTTVINGTTTIEVFNNGQGQHVDRQQFTLPAAFASQTLTTMVLTDTGQPNFQRVFMTGLTVEYIPAPAGLALLGMSLAAAARRRR
jgi:uncharacterized protein (TIGR03382 family)